MEDDRYGIKSFKAAHKKEKPVLNCECADWLLISNYFPAESSLWVGGYSRGENWQLDNVEWKKMVI